MTKSKDLEALSKSQLKRAVQAEEKRLEDIVAFASDMMVKCGEQTYNKEIGNMGDRSQYAWQLCDFYKFSFHMEHGVVWTYGNTLKIEYRPDDAHAGETVFEVEYSGSFRIGDDESKIVTHVKGNWEDKIAQLMKTKGKAIADYKAGLKKAEAEEKAYKKKADAEHREWDEKQELLRKARDLKMTD
jgi:hypothetical protein